MIVAARFNSRFKIFLATKWPEKLHSWETLPQIGHESLKNIHLFWNLLPYNLTYLITKIYYLYGHTLIPVFIGSG